MLEGLGLFGVCTMMVLLIRWLLAHDSIPNSKSDGLFALRDASKQPDAEGKGTAHSS